MEPQWIRRGEKEQLWEYYVPGSEDNYKVPSFMPMTDDFFEEYYVGRGFTKNTKWAYWLHDPEPMWYAMPDHVVDIEDAKAYALIMWRMR